MKVFKPKRQTKQMFEFITFDSKGFLRTSKSIQAEVFQFFKLEKNVQFGALVNNIQKASSFKHKIHITFWKAWPICGQGRAVPCRVDSWNESGEHSKWISFTLFSCNKVEQRMWHLSKTTFVFLQLNLDKNKSKLLPLLTKK